jgi:Rrf2 family protein
MSNLFRVTARDHGALILMTALAERYGEGGYVSLQGVADEMGLSQGYLEEIAISLKRAKLIKGKQGPKGGYCLASLPQKISVEDVLTAVEGPIELVACQSKGSVCPIASKCLSKTVWSRIQNVIRETLQGIALSDPSLTRSGQAVVREKKI